MSEFWIVAGLTAAFMAFTRYPVLCRPPHGMPEWVNRSADRFWRRGVARPDAWIVWVLTGLSFASVLTLWPFGLVFLPAVYLGMMFLAAYPDADCRRTELRVGRKSGGGTTP